MPPAPHRSIWPSVLAALALTIAPSVAIQAQAQPAWPAPRVGADPFARPLFSGPALTTAMAERQDAARDERRACDGCPRRSVGRALLAATYVNVVYGSINLTRGQVTGRITPKSWWTNLRRGWEFDLDDFQVNQFGHPYQGSNYYNAGRAHGLTFWESAAVTAFGSATWEYLGETNRASVNDFVNTTMGGIALGEMFHRVGWLIRDPQSTGGRRLRKELLAMAVDPITGITRLTSSDRRRLSARPTDVIPSSLSARGSAGILWRGNNVAELRANTLPFFEINLLYGDAATHVERPYDRFEVRFDFGGGSGLSELQVRGDIFMREFRDGRFKAGVMQGYQYNSNAAYKFGAQSVIARTTWMKPLANDKEMTVNATGGLTLLGAVDSLPPGQTIELPRDDDSGLGQGVSTGPRNYDYGPGSNFGVSMLLSRRGRTFLRTSYEGFHLYITDGVRANHFLQRGVMALDLPVRGRLGLGVTGEFFARHTFYDQRIYTEADGPSTSHFIFPQFRVAMTWRTN